MLNPDIKLKHDVDSGYVGELFLDYEGPCVQNATALAAKVNGAKLVHNESLSK